MPTSRAIAAAVAEASPESTLTSTPWPRRKEIVSRTPGRSCSASTTSPSISRSRRRKLGRLGSRQRPRCARARARDALRLARSAPRLAASRAASARARPDRGSRSPARRRSSAGGWRTAPRPRASAGRAGLDAATASSVRLRTPALAAKAPRASRRRASSTARRGNDLDDPQRGIGERPRLVDADRVDRGQRLDRVELLGEHTAPGHAHRGDRVGEAHEHHEPLGDQAHDARGRRRDGRVGAHVAVIERVAEHRAERDDQRDERVEQAVDGALERRAGVAEGARLSRQPGREAVGPDRRDLVDPGAFADERARAELVARRVADGLGLAAQDRLVEAAARSRPAGARRRRPGRPAAAPRCRR